MLLHRHVTEWAGTPVKTLGLHTRGHILSACYIKKTPTPERSVFVVVIGSVCSTPKAKMLYSRRRGVCVWWGGGGGGGGVQEGGRG